MHYKDLDLCYYGDLADQLQWRTPLYAVGWLEHGFPFATGDVDRAVRERFDMILRGCASEFAYAIYAGGHQCSLCEAPLRTFPRGCSMNVVIPGLDCAYATPAMLGHYMDAHRYLPPAEFCAAVLRCPDPTTPEYPLALERANGGKNPLPRVFKVDGRVRAIEVEQEPSPFGGKPHKDLLKHR